MKKISMFIIISILCVAIIAVLLLITGKKDFLYLSDDNIYFGMTTKLLTDKKGEPAEVTKSVSDTTMDEYTYLEVINGHSANCSYFFWGSRLIEASITIDDIDYNSALQMVEEIVSLQEKWYSNDHGYYQTKDIKETGKEFAISNGVQSGATGISFDYAYSSRTLTMNAVRQK